MFKHQKINQLIQNREKKRNYKISTILHQLINLGMMYLIRRKLYLKIKPDPLTNPHMMSEHDQRPQFAIEEDEKKQMKEEQKQQDYIDDCMGTHKQTKQWIKYFPTADLNHNFVDHRRPNFIDKGNYQEPGLILFQFLREGASAKDDFQLFHRQLRTNDKHLYLGIQMDPNQQ